MTSPPDERSPFRPQPGDAGVLRFDKLKCPTCGTKMDAVSETDGRPMTRTPDNGDRTLCLRCAGLAVFCIGPLGVALRAATADEFAEFQADPESRRTLEAMHMMFEAGKRPPQRD